MSSSQPLALSTSAAATTTSTSCSTEKMKKCDGCGKEDGADLKLKMCGACHSVSYCSSACQTTAWPGHKSECKRIQLRIKNGSGAGTTVDMGALLASLSSLRRYTDVDMYNACGRGQYEELQKVLRQTGLDSNWADPDFGETAVNAAAKQGHDKCLSAVIQYGGADLSKVDKNGFAPIHAACLAGRIACLILLLDHGVEANVPTANERGNTPAALCCMVGHVKCLALLLDRGADPDLVDKGGSTPIHYACDNGHLKCAQLLIARGANYNAKDASGGRTPLQLARRKGHTACVELLLKNNAVESGVAIIPLTEAQKVRLRCYCMFISFREVFHPFFLPFFFSSCVYHCALFQFL